MINFLKKATLVILLPLLFYFFRSVVALSKFHENYYYSSAGSVKLLKSTKNQQDSDNNLLVIGCSNLQFNIDFEKVQDSTNYNIDFLYYSGAQYSSFLKYLVTKGYSKKYNKVIFYTSYNQLKENKLFYSDKVGVKIYMSYDYALSLLKNNPLLFFYNWSNVYDTVSHYRKEKSNYDFITNQDNDIKSFFKEPTIQNSNCKIAKHLERFVEIPEYTRNDLSFIKGLKQNCQDIYIIFTPVANIPENVREIEKKKQNWSEFSSLALNEPNSLDSNLFYDSHYHLNFHGRNQETQRFINIVRKIHVIALK